MTPSKIFLYFCLSFISGIFLNSIIFIPQLLTLVFLIFGLILISIFWQYKKLVIIGFCILFLVAGIWRHGKAELRIMNNELRVFNGHQEQVSLIGIVSAEPDIREKIIKLIINAESLNGGKIRGKILVTTNRYPEYQYRQKLKISGKLQSPPIFEGFNYQDYLKKDGIYSVMNFPKIELVGSNFGSPLKKVIFSLKNKFKDSVSSFISPPQIGILEALVFGDEEKIPKTLKDKLNITGTRHITAVSGMNITIIAFLILSFALNLGFWRQQTFYLSMVLLFFYILMIGAPPSAVRAGIMAGFLMIAQYFGRLSTASRAVVFAACSMLILNPLLLRQDIGFQLSFLAILGMIYFQPIFSNWLKKIPNPKFFPVRTTLSATLAAQIFTLPVLIYNFGYISLVSPIANILIVPFLAPINILIFIFGFSAMIFWPLGYFLSFFVWLCLTYIILIINWFSKFPLVSVTIENLHWAWLIIFYLILSYLAFWLNKKEKLKFLKY